MNAVVAKLRELETPGQGRTYLRLAGLVDRLEMKEGYAGGHASAVGAIALAIATELRLSAADRRSVELGALLHDVGKLSIPDRVLPRGKLHFAQATSILRRPTVKRRNKSTCAAAASARAMLKEALIKSHNARCFRCG